MASVAWEQFHKQKKEIKSDSLYINTTNNPLILLKDDKVKKDFTTYLTDQYGSALGIQSLAMFFISLMFPLLFFIMKGKFNTDLWAVSFFLLYSFAILVNLLSIFRESSNNFIIKKSLDDESFYSYFAGNSQDYETKPYIHVGDMTKYMKGE